MKKTVIFVFLAMVLIGSCAAQSATNDAQKIVGTWVTEDGKTLVFNANGTGTGSNWQDSDRDGNIFWGVSTSGVLAIVFPREYWEKTFCLSPDGRRMIYNGRVFQKK